MRPCLPQQRGKVSEASGMNRSSSAMPADHPGVDSGHPLRASPAPGSRVARIWASPPVEADAVRQNRKLFSRMRCSLSGTAGPGHAGAAIESTEMPADGR